MTEFWEQHAKLQKPRPTALVTDERRRKVESEYARNSKEARKRDRHCRICGSMFALETHHLVPRSLVGKALRNALSNLITLCHDCHGEVTKHVMKLQPHDATKGARGKVRVLKYEDAEKGYIVAMEAV